jgi:hypothetical protein
MAARGGELLLTSRMRLFRVILVVAVLASAVLAGIARSGQVEAAGWLGQWSKRTAITLDHSRFDADLSGFPVLVKFGTSAGRDSQDVSFVFDELVSDVNRFKIAVTSADGVSQCYVEIVRWSQAEETAFLYVKVPMVSYAADTVLFLYYDVTKPDNTTFVGDVGSVAGRVVWANGFSHIYHLTEQGNGTAGEFKDSKGTVDGTASKGIDPRWTGTHYPTRVNSPVGFGQNFGGNLDPNVITIPDNDDFSVVSAREITISFWFNPDTLTFGPPKDYPFSWGGFVDIMGKGQNDGNLEWDFNFYSNNAPVASRAYNWTTFYMYSLTTNYGNGCATENPPGSAVVTSAGAWYYVTATMKASPSWFSEQVKGAVNSGNAYDFSGPPYYVVPGNGTAPVNIGTRQGHLLFDGSIAGLRFSNVIRSSAWRDASYYSDKDALLTFGSPVTMVPPTTSVPAVATVAASGITTNSSTLNGTLDSMGSAASVAVSFEYGLTTGYGTVVPAVPSSLSAAGSFSAIVSSLSPGTLYHYRARAVGDGTAFGSDRTTTTTAMFAPPLDMIGSSVADGQVGSAYSQVLAVTGGIAPYAWFITAGSLPGGLSLDVSAGTVRGTPTIAGTSSFTVKVTDSASPTRTTFGRTLSITVNPLPVPSPRGGSGGVSPPGVPTRRPPKIYDVKTTRTTGTTAEITWATDLQSTTEIAYAATEYPEPSLLVDETAVTDHVVALAGLTPYTTYQATVTSRDRDNSLAASETIVFTTQGSLAPASPIAAASQETTSAVIGEARDALPTSGGDLVPSFTVKPEPAVPATPVPQLALQRSGDILSGTTSDRVLEVLQTDQPVVIRWYVLALIMGTAGLAAGVMAVLLYRRRHELIMTWIAAGRRPPSK